MNEHLSLASQTLLTPRRAGLRAGADNTVEVLVRIQAPDAPATAAAARPPQALALVIDRSGSMEGRPLAEALRCAEFVITRLRASDSVSLVQFDNRVDRLCPATPLAEGASLRHALAQIQAGGSTDLHGGWLEGARTLTNVAGAGLKRVVLLSDGGANLGITDPAEITAQCAAWARLGITTSTYGLGTSFNESLMVAMARSGGGNPYYGETADDLMEPFQQELDLLANLCLWQVELRVSAPDGVRVEVLNDLARAGDAWRLPDLAWGAEAWALLRVTVPAGALPAAGARFGLLRVAVTGQSLEGEAVALERAGLALPVMPAAALDALADDELVVRRSLEVEAGRVLVQMCAAADGGDWPTVDRLLAEAQSRFAGHAWVSTVLGAMIGLARSRSRDRMTKEATYSSGKLSRRLAARDETESILCTQTALPAYLRRKPLQGKKDL